jgi:membrane protein implicated in regulation of membrane protease activity
MVLARVLLLPGQWCFRCGPNWLLDATRKEYTMRRLWRDYGLGWVLLALFLASWVVQTWTGWREFRAEQSEHQQTAAVFGSGGYVWNWARTTFENWQSEFLQLFAMVTLTSVLIFRGSAESKDGDEELKEALARIEGRLNDLTATGAHTHGRVTEPVAVGLTGD